MANLTATALLKMQVRAQGLFGEAQGAQYRAQTGTIDMLLNEQTSTLNTEIQSGGKQRKVEVSWIIACSGSVADTAADCNFATNAADSEVKEYDLTRSRSFGFSQPDGLFRRNVHNFEEAVAKSQLNCELKQVKDFNARCTTVINTLAGLGTNKFVATVDGGAPGAGFYAGQYEFNTTTNTTEIPASAMTPELFQYLRQVAYANGFVDPCLLHGFTLVPLIEKALIEAQNAQNGAANATRVQLLRRYLDIELEVNLSGAPRFFMIDRGTFAMLNRADFTPTPEAYNNGADIVQWKAPLTQYPSIEADYAYRTACVDKKNINHQWECMIPIDAVKNPVSACADGYTGVLAFEFV